MGSAVELPQIQSCTNELGSSELLLNHCNDGLISDAPGRRNGSVHLAISVYDERSLSFNEVEANCLEQIEKIPRLKLILTEWESKLRDSKARIERKETLSYNVKNEIYSLIGFFSVFQGVVLTSVAQASSLRCHNWWGPFSLSLLASICTLFAVAQKFWNFIEWKRAVKKEVKDSKVLKEQISNLKITGQKFDFFKFAPDRRPPKQKEIHGFWERVQAVHFKRYYFLALLVILSILGFSAIILISCIRILCDSGKTGA